MSTILLQRYANREYRLTHQNLYSRKPIGGDKYAEKQAEKYANAIADTFVLSQNLIEGECASIEDGKLKRHEFGEVDARLGLHALDIINEFQTKAKSSVKGGWGHLSKPTSFTKNARHRLLEAGAIVDKECGLNAWEVTCTLPGGTTDAIRTLAENTGWIMNELTQIIRRAKCKYWFYVWEFQKRGALHLHLLIADPQESLQGLAQTLESRWWGALQSLSRKNQVDLFARRGKGTWAHDPTRWQSHIACIKKSVAAYFSKYAGKGCNPGSKTPFQTKLFSPSRWWGCSTVIKTQIKACRQKWTIELSPSTAKKVQEYLQLWLADKSRIKTYQYEFQLGRTANGTELGGGSVCINYYTDQGFAKMQQWEAIIWSGVLKIANEYGEYDYPCSGWTGEDHACPVPLDAAIDAYKAQHQKAKLHAHTSPPSPHSQPPSLASKLRKARGTQAQPTLALRALALQFLAGGGGGDITKDPELDLIPQIPGLTNLLTGY